MSQAPLTVGTALRSGHLALAQASDAPQLDAERLLLAVLAQTESSWLHTHTDSMLTSPQHEQYAALLARRQHGEPLAYLVGSAEFYGRTFNVTSAVLIPRPATEDLVEQALVVIKTLAYKLGRPIVVADIGTGSGIIASTLALETIPTEVSKIIATDISPEALAVAQRNAALHKVADRINFLQGDMFAPLHDEKIDLIVSNPPYVPTSEVAAALTSSDPTRTGLTYEPSQALDGGSDGQRYTQLLTQQPIPVIYETLNGEIATHNLSRVF